jgi:hypothetical protein
MNPVEAAKTPAVPGTGVSFRVGKSFIRHGKLVVEGSGFANLLTDIGVKYF